MCPLWPLHVIVLYVTALTPVWLALTSSSAHAVNITFHPSKVDQLPEGNSTEVTVEFSDLDPGKKYQYRVETVSQTDSIGVEPREFVFRLDSLQEPAVWRGSLNITGLFLGYATVRVTPGSPQAPPPADARLPVSVVRTDRHLDKIFTISVATLVGLTYVKMGCTLDLSVIKRTLIRPVGPAIGVITQYIIMPLTGFGLSMAFFTDPGLQLGLFLTGCSPGGGASNIWTYLLNGNINLSVTMTLVSSLLAFAAMPGWVFALSHQITENTTIVIPYKNILMLLMSLIVPCCVGLLINRFLPRVASFMRKILKPWSVLLFIFLVTFGIYANLYMFQLLTWQLVVACGILPMAGFVGGAVASWLTGRTLEDAIAISVETGVQNTGVAIFMLKFSLPEPASDLSIIVPVIVATATPAPLFAALLFQKLQPRCCPRMRRPKPPELAADAESSRQLMPDDTETETDSEPGQSQ